MRTRHLVIHTDGGARGNPGPAAIGVIIQEGGRVIDTIGRSIGSTTNNQAEYQAVVAALEYALAQQAAEVDLYCDSELVVKQLTGHYQLKNKELGPWYLKIHSLANQIGQVRYHLIRREENTPADTEVNRVLDQELLA